MDLMDDENLKKSVIEQMMGELDDEHVNDLKKSSKGPVKGVEITISVSPKSEDELKDELPEEVQDAVGMVEGGEVHETPHQYGDFGCSNPDHLQKASFGDIESKPSESYIDQLLKMLDDDERDA